MGTRFPAADRVQLGGGLCCCKIPAAQGMASPGIQADVNRRVNECLHKS